LSRFAYDGNKERLEQDIQNLRKHGLISHREIEARNEAKFRVPTLTKDGKRFLQHQNRVPKSQAYASEERIYFPSMSCAEVEGWEKKKQLESSTAAAEPCRSGATGWGIWV
jgi:hypothetical protein